MPNPNDAPETMTLFQRIRVSIFPGLSGPAAHRKDHRHYFNTLALHFRPRTVPEKTLRFSLTWGLGGMAAVLILLLFGTGILMKFIYLPYPEKAYASVVYLQQNILFGQFVRNIHHWSGNLLLIIVFLHFLRVFFTGAFHPPRQFNWIIGLGLFLIVVTSNFTGYLLPWDQLSFWAITICTGMLEYIPGAGLWLQRLIRGGQEVGPATLSNFYAIHTAILPVLLIFLMPFHFWRIRKAGGLVVPRSPDESVESSGERVPGIPNLILREVSVALVLVAVVFVISVFFNAPLVGKANPGLSPNPTKAPWYFVGFQEILLHFNPLVALCLIPLAIMACLVAIPYLIYTSDTSGVWFTSSKGRQMAIWAVGAALIATPLYIVMDELFFHFSAWMPGMPPLISEGLIPFGLISIGIGIFLIFLKHRFSANRNETLQTAMVLFLTVFIILTITGIWFRGSGMKLVWPG